MRSIQYPTAQLNLGHISDYNLERHYLGMVTDEGELAEFEEHRLFLRALRGTGGRNTGLRRCYASRRHSY
jgi:hypothetical protein